MCCSRELYYGTDNWKILLIIYFEGGFLLIYINTHYTQAIYIHFSIIHTYVSCYLQIKYFYGVFGDMALIRMSQVASWESFTVDDAAALIIISDFSFCNCRIESKDKIIKKK